MRQCVILLRTQWAIVPVVDDQWGPPEPARIFPDRHTANLHVRSLSGFADYRIVELPLAPRSEWGRYFDEQ